MTPLRQTSCHNSTALWTPENPYLLALVLPQKISVSHEPNNRLTWHSPIDDKPHAYRDEHNQRNHLEILGQLAHYDAYRDDKEWFLLSHPYQIRRCNSKLASYRFLKRDNWFHPHEGRKVKLFHSDRGKEFDNQLIDEMLEAFGIPRSLSQAGCPYDNAVAESTYRSFKL